MDLDNKFKLTDVAECGHGEASRFIFALVNVEYEDIRVPNDFGSKDIVEYKELKASLPWGQPPILEYNGEVIAQCRAIMRFLAKKFGLCGNTDVNAAHCDEIADATYEFLDVWAEKHFPEMDKTSTREEGIEKFKSGPVKVFLHRLENRLKGKNWLVVGDSPTWADVYVATCIRQIELISNIRITSEYEKLHKLYTKIFDIPQIKKVARPYPLCK